MSPSPHRERLDFIHHRQGRRLADNQALTVDDWRHIHQAWEAFQVQVRAIVWEAEHREKKEVTEVRYV